MNIVFLDRATLSSHVTVRAASGMRQWSEFQTTQPTQTIERCRGADVVITNKVLITRKTLEACPSIKHIAVAATGYNCVDTQACAELGVSVSNIPNYANITVPEHVINLMLTLRRELISYRAQVIDGKWQSNDTFCLFDKPIRDLNGSTFGVIGFGELGQATSRLAHALGMQVIYHSPSQKYSDFARQVSLSELLTQSDVISLHCTLNSETENLIAAAELAMMQKHAVLINTARGGIANEQAVSNAILKQEIGAIGFDVLCQEPPVNGSPLLEIAHLNNVIITPHIAWASERALQAVADILIDNVDAFIQGQPQNLVI